MMLLNVERLAAMCVKSISENRFGVGLTGRLLLLSLVSVLLVGCAGEPTLLSDDEQTVVPVVDAKSRYNKSYRVRGKTYVPMQSAVGYKATGTASWYGAESGNRTASGARFHPHGLTAAHKTLPIPCKVRVTNLRNGRHVDVTINDRGPFEGNRLIDLSKGAAEHIGMRGLAEVTVEYLG